MDDDPEVVVCQGPPLCDFDAANVSPAQFDAHTDACTLCKRIKVGALGSETEYQKKAN